jgi:sirohydrochlorin ferrochelatase
MPDIGSSVEPAALLVVAHGTASAAGSATTRRLVAAIAAARPGVAVDLCFLDVARPSLADAVERVIRSTVVVPLLLSTGYHVTTDIPAVVAGRSEIRVARHLGPDPLIVDVLVDRLHEAGGRADGEASTLLVAAGSTQPEARYEVDSAAQQLAERLGAPVSVLTMAENLDESISAATPPVRIATYLLAEGQFVDRLDAAAGGRARVARPLGVHPAFVSLVWSRYDEAHSSAWAVR